MSGYYEQMGNTPSPGPYFRRNPMEKSDGQYGQSPFTPATPVNYKGQTTVRENFTVVDPAQAPTSPWRPGVFRSAPWLGLLALLGAILCAIGAVACLITADGRETHKWPVEDHPLQLSVALATLMGVGNGALAFAHHEGVTLSWWIRMMKGGPLSDSHQVWQCGTSAWHSVLSIRHISKVSLTSIVLVMLFIDSPLIQRAATFVTVAEYRPITLQAAVSTDILSRDTAMYGTRAKAVNLLTSNFSQIGNEYSNRKDILLDTGACNGTCKGTLVDPGFDIDCKTNTTMLDLSLLNKPAGNATVGSIRVDSNGDYRPSIITVLTSFKPKADGTLVNTNCTLRAAQVKYPVRFVNGTILLEPANLRNINYTIALQEYPRESASMNMYSRLGGIAYAANVIYMSEIKVYQAGNLAFMDRSPMQFTFINSTQKALGTTAMSWSDPTDTVLNTIRELTFRAAIAFSNNTPASQKVEATEERQVTKYELRPSFLGGALAIIGVSALLVACLFNEYWLLGRKVSMSPLEIATAFQAPMTVGADTNAEADVLAQQLRARHIKYGAIQTNPGDGSIQKLAVASSDNVSWPVNNR